jgi:hypothetical protein
LEPGALTWLSLLYAGGGGGGGGGGRRRSGDDEVGIEKSIDKSSYHP